MDIKGYINVPVSGVFNGGSQPERAAVKPPVKDSAPVITQPVKVPENADKALYEQVRQASEAVKTTFAVSDVRFTIFKDLAGDYVTRFTSLRDGSVKYFPQKSLFDMAKIRAERFEGILDSQA